MSVAVVVVVPHFDHAVVHYFRGHRAFCWTGLTGQAEGLVGLEGEAENHLGLTAVSYEARTEDIPRACGPSIAEEAMAKREVNHD